MKYELICRQIMNCKRMGERVPSKKKLLKRFYKGEIYVIYRSEPGDYTNGLTIFSDGSILYGDGVKTTVFAAVSFWIKKGVIDPDTNMPSEGYITNPYYDREDIYGIPVWLHELIMFGEERIESNEKSRVRHHEFSFEHPEDFRKKKNKKGAKPVACVDGMDEEIINKEIIPILLSCINDMQRRVIIDHVVYNCSFEAIAHDLNSMYELEGIDNHASRQSVKQMYDRAIRKIRRIYPPEEYFY